jgi:murein DD-endopeptidase MepM/ murein hydrolase activator NlpD
MSISTSLRFLAIAGALLGADATFAKDSISIQSLVANDTVKSQSSGVYQNFANPEPTNALATQIDREIVPNSGNNSHNSPIKLAASISGSRFGTDEDNGAATEAKFPSPFNNRITSLPTEPVEASVIIPVPPPLTSVIKTNRSTLAPVTRVIKTTPVSTVTPSAPTGQSATTPPTARPTAFNDGGTRESNFDLIYPLANIAPTTSGYGWRTHPLTGTRRFHSGIDIGASTGTPVVAAGSGTVVKAGWLSGYGKVIIIQHSPTKQTVYGHLSQISVQSGQTITQGTVIGQVGSTGNSTGPHLHYEIRMPNGSSWAAVNPTEEFKYAADNLRRAQPFAQKEAPSGF